MKDKDILLISRTLKECEKMRMDIVHQLDIKNTKKSPSTKSNQKRRCYL